MWLNYNLGKVNLETMLASQRLSLRQADLCGVAPESAGAYMRLHISARLCFADLCGSLLFTAWDICWFLLASVVLFKFSRHLSYHLCSLGFISHVSFYMQQSGHHFAFARDYGFVCWIFNWLVCCSDNDFNSSVSGSSDRGCGEGVFIG